MPRGASTPAGVEHAVFQLRGLAADPTAGVAREGAARDRDRAPSLSSSSSRVSGDGGNAAEIEVFERGLFHWPI